MVFIKIYDIDQICVHLVLHQQGLLALSMNGHLLHRIIGLQLLNRRLVLQVLAAWVELGIREDLIRESLIRESLVQEGLVRESLIREVPVVLGRLRKLLHRCG